MIWPIVVGLLIWTLVSLVYAVWHLGDKHHSHQNRWTLALEYFLNWPILLLALVFGWGLNLCKIKFVRRIFELVYFITVIPVAFFVDYIRRHRF